MLSGITREVFESTLRRTLSPSHPITSPEFLRGREKNLDQVQRAFVHAGRQVFIYGDRGVGKTSLALTAAHQHESSDREPMLLSCRGSFFTTMRDLLNRLIGWNVLSSKKTTSFEGGLNRLVAVKKGTVSETTGVAELTSINEVTAALQQICQKNKPPRVCIFDEFENVDPRSDRKFYGDLIKQISDQDIPLKIIFGGIGSSVTALLDDHPSANRYISAVELKTLNPGACIEILDGAAKALGTSIEENTKYRVAMISDGFPHYVHLVCENILWSMFNDNRLAPLSNIQHFKEAIESSTESAEPYFREKYARATQKYRDDYEKVLWAAANSRNLEQRSLDIYEVYKEILFGNQDILSRERFNQRLNSLKRDSHGNILTGTRQGWYRFTESMMRGYVRLAAERSGTPLMIDHPLASKR